MITTCLRFNLKTDCATLIGSDGSNNLGFPVATLQKEHALVHTSPIIIIVACFFSQQLPIFGQAASSHTVVIFKSSKRSFVFENKSPCGALTFSQDGLGGDILSGLLTFSGCLMFLISFIFLTISNELLGYMHPRLIHAYLQIR